MHIDQIGVFVHLLIDSNESLIFCSPGITLVQKMDGRDIKKIMKTTPFLGAKKEVAEGRGADKLICLGLKLCSLEIV